MSTFNKVILVGHLGADPVVRTIENNVKVADFSIATNEVFQKNGENKESLDWHEVVAWRRLADFSEIYLKKGSKIMVEGKLKTSTWLDKETGGKRKSIFILADQIRFMEKKDHGGLASDGIGAEVREALADLASESAGGEDESQAHLENPGRKKGRREAAASSTGTAEMIASEEDNQPF